jgi:hypothetical protein
MFRSYSAGKPNPLFTSPLSAADVLVVRAVPLFTSAMNTVHFFTYRQTRQVMSC